MLSQDEAIPAVYFLFSTFKVPLRRLVLRNYLKRGFSATIMTGIK